jgi:holin-like protein
VVRLTPILAIEQCAVDDSGIRPAPWIRIRVRMAGMPSTRGGTDAMSSRSARRAVSHGNDDRNVRGTRAIRAPDAIGLREACRTAGSTRMAEIVGRTASAWRAAKPLRVAVQLVVLVAVSQVADLVVGAMRLPVPSNVVGMLVLFLLLQYGVLHLEQVSAGATLLVRHLAFFFVPIAVGLMAYRELLATTGVALLLVIAASALVGMLVAGLVAQLLKRVRPA